MMADQVQVGVSDRQQAYTAQSIHYSALGKMGPGGMMPGMAIMMMPKPDPIPGVPNGLEYLVDLNQILVHQQVEVAELLSGHEGCNKYVVLNTLGQQIYFAHEESSSCCRMCCGNERSFVMHLFESNGIEAIRIRRNYKCCAKCAWCTCVNCCVEEISVEAPVGEIVGYCRQRCSFMSPKFEVKDNNKELMYSIRGPMFFCQNNCCRKDVNFSIKDTNGNVIGKISKEWSGINRERYTDADNYSITFPTGMDVRHKVLLMGAIFLIDFMFFEDEPVKIVKAKPINK